MLLYFWVCFLLDKKYSDAAEKLKKFESTQDGNLSTQVNT